MSNTQHGLSKKHYVQNYVYPERSILGPLSIESVYSVGIGKYLINNQYYFDKNQGRIFTYGVKPKLFIPLASKTCSQIKKLHDWSEPLKIDNSLKEGLDFFKKTVKSGKDLLDLDIYNVPLNSTDTTKFQFTSPYYYFTSKQLKNKLYNLAGTQFSCVIDAYLGIVAQRYVNAMPIIKGCVYVVPNDILEEVVEEITQHICSSVY